MPRPAMSRRSFNRTAVASAFAAIAPQAPASQDKSPRGTVLKESARRDVIKQDLPASRSVSSHWWKLYTRQERARRRNGVMAFVVAGSIASKVADEPERTFHAGEAWWEPPGAVHRVSRNASSSEPARLLAIYIAPADATAEDLMKPI